MWYQVVSRSNTLIFLLPCPAISPAARPYSQPPALHPLPAKITEAWLARRLSSFGIRSHTIRVGPDRARGYHLAEFVPAFDRFLVAKCDTVTNPLSADWDLRTSKRTPNLSPAHFQVSKCDPLRICDSLNGP